MSCPNGGDDATWVENDGTCRYCGEQTRPEVALLAAAQETGNGLYVAVQMAQVEQDNLRALLATAVGLLVGVPLVKPELTMTGSMKYFCQLCRGAGADTPNLVGHMKTVDNKTACEAPAIRAFLAREPIAAIVKETA